jgi:hypothetical protein
MDYTALFNLLYSTEISEATKDEIVSKINTSISESYEVKPIVETYLELLDTLVFSTASESLIYNIIDEAFSQLSEETINEVSNEWVKKKVGDSLKARQSAVDSANKSVKSGIVGLSQLHRQDQAQQNLDRGKEKAASIMNKVERRKEAAKAENANPYTPKAETPKAEGAMGKLKSAVGKVKSWASNVDKTPDYVGLSRAIGAKANKDNIGAEALRQQTTHKTEAPAEEKQPEVKAEAIKTTPKVEKVKQPKAKKEKQPEPAQQKLNLETPKAEEKQPEVKTEVKADDATKAAKKTSTRAAKISKAKKIVADAATDKATNKEKTSAEEKQPEDNIPNKDNPELHALHKELADNSKKAQEGDKEAKKKFRNARKKIAEIEADLKSGEKYTDVYGNEREAGKSLSPETNKEKAAEEAPKKRTGSIKINAGSKKANKPQETQTPEVEAKTDKSQETSKAKNKPAEEKTGAQKEYDKLVRKMNTEKENRRKDQERMLQTYKDRYAEKTATPGYDQTEMNDLKAKIEKLEKELGQAKVTEALSDLAVLLLDTNISENCFVEVMEMVAANKANAQKALARDEQSAMAVIDDINKDLQAGKPVDPEKVKDAEEKRKKQEHFEELFKKKFGDTA